LRTAGPKGAKGKCDRLFSLAVRARGHCQKCGRKTQLQCAHIISRRYSATRTDLRNAWCLCAGCHLEVDTHAGVKMELVEQTIGEETYWELYYLAQSFRGRMDWAAEAKALGETA
jgi:5-methylcytosine-specific restriction endonuclease McrA